MEPATQKQIEFARKLGIESPEKYDKQAIRGLIDVKIADRDKGKPEKMQPEAPKGPERTYHLTPEQVRTNALEAAQRWYPELQDSEDEIKSFWQCVHEFEKYISG